MKISDVSVSHRSTKIPVRLFQTLHFVSNTQAELAEVYLQNRSQELRHSQSRALHCVDHVLHAGKLLQIQAPSDNNKMKLL